MPRTIPDDEYNFLQGRRQVADFVESIYNDPALTKEAKALIKRKYPNLQIPDYDIEQRVEERFAKEREERDNEKREQRAQQEERDFNEKRTSTQKKYGLTDEGMQDLEKFMLEKNVGDYDVAATYHVAKNPRPSDATFSDGRWNHDKAPGFAEISKDPEGWAKGELLKSLYSQQEREKNQRF